MRISKSQHRGLYYFFGSETSCTFDRFKVNTYSGQLSVDLYRDNVYLMSVNFEHSKEFCKQWRLMSIKD